jgi:hypothetical protein
MNRTSHAGLTITALVAPAYPTNALNRRFDAGRIHVATRHGHGHEAGAAAGETFFDQ